MERRKQPRTTIECQVYFICVSEDGRQTAEDIGVAVDVSAGGMKLESTTPINTMEIRIIASAADNQQIEVRGGVIYSMQVGGDRYHTGIFFPSDSEEAARFVEQLMLTCDGE